jgi:hypothetical protein
VSPFPLGLERVELLIQRYPSYDNASHGPLHTAFRRMVTIPLPPRRTLQQTRQPGRQRLRTGAKRWTPPRATIRHVQWLPTNTEGGISVNPASRTGNRDWNNRRAIAQNVSIEDSARDRAHRGDRARGVGIAISAPILLNHRA